MLKPMWGAFMEYEMDVSLPPHIKINMAVRTAVNLTPRMGVCNWFSWRRCCFFYWVAGSRPSINEVTQLEQVILTQTGSNPVYVAEACPDPRLADAISINRT